MEAVYEPIPEAPTDEALARRVVAGEVDLFEVIVRRNNTRLHRAVRSILADEATVDDVMQRAWLLAWRNLARFEGHARLSTWLVRIALNEAYAHLRRERRLTSVDELSPEMEATMGEDRAEDPERGASAKEIAALVERAVDGLAPSYRTVFVLREIDGMSTEETAAALDVSPDVVKTRLHRARGMLQDRLLAMAGRDRDEVYAFHAPRCDRLTAAVMAAIRAEAGVRTR